MSTMLAVVVLAASAATDVCDELRLEGEARSRCAAHHLTEAAWIAMRRGEAAQPYLDQLLQTFEAHPQHIQKGLHGVNIALLDRFNACDEPFTVELLASLNRAVQLKVTYGDALEFYCEAEYTIDGIPAPMRVRQ